MLRTIHALPLLALLLGCSLVVRPAPEAPEPVEEGEPITAVSVAAIASDKVPEGLSAYWDKVRSGGPLKIGINNSYPPFGVPVDPTKAKPGQPALAGFDVDLAQHLGETLGVEVELVGLRSKDVMDRLNDGTIDLAMAGVTRTVFRAAQVNFSAPYVTVTQAALVERHLVDGARGNDEERRRGTLESYDDLADVGGIKIGAVRFTRPHRLALGNFPDAEVIAYDSIGDASQALVSGEVNALVHDGPYIRVWPLLNPSHSGRFRALLQPVTEEPICIAIRKGDLEFLRFLDAYAAEVREDGTVERLLRRHFVDAAWRETAALEEAAQ